MKMRISGFSLAVLLAMFAVGEADCAIKLHGYITDNMVIQRDAQLNVVGTAAKNAQVEVFPGWTDQVYKGVSDAEGRFDIKVATPSAGGPYAMLVKCGKDRTGVRNILSGDVWVCSGQSNMEFPVKGWGTIMNADELINTAQRPDIRLFQVKRTMSLLPKEDCQAEKGGWVECNPATVQPFSAVGYLFAREIQDSVGIPIGIVNASWGGTPAEAWTSLEGVRSAPDFDEEIRLMEGNAFDADKMTEKKNSELMDLADDAKLPPVSEWKEMPTGKFWEDSVLPKFDGVVFLKKTIDIPQEIAGKPMEINLGGLKDYDVAYFNGKEIGRGKGHKNLRKYTVPAGMVKGGKAELLVKVINYHGYGGFSGKGKLQAISGDVSIPLDKGWKFAEALNFAKMQKKPVAPYSKYYPTALYNTMIKPLAPMTVKGVIWYQGCANVRRDKQYGPLIKNMIGDWRSQWGKDMPFYFVQLAGFGRPMYCQPNSSYANIREAQTKALELDNTAMAVAVDLGNPEDIHPQDKQTVAHRLALIALNRDYGKNVNYEAPKCIFKETVDNKLRLRFDAKLKPRTCAVTGFIISPEEGKYFEATGKLVDDCTIELSSPYVKNPVNVKYNWTAYPNGNLYGTDGLPVAPFRMD